MNLTAKEFELLLTEFCKQDLPEHFSVEHDIKDIGTESENLRQIDTKIKGKLGVSDILICGEAKNWSIPVGSDTIDSLVGKYMSGEIKASKVILFSNQGFYEPAITRAKKLGIELIEPNEIGKPIQKIPHVIGLGYLGGMELTVIGKGPQYSEMSINPYDYVIIKGSHKISLEQNFYRIIVTHLSGIPNKAIDTVPTQITLEDENVLYELKDKIGYRYNATFKVKIEIQWDFFLENLPIGILKHVNTNEIQFVNMQGSGLDVFNKVMFSDTKINYENKVELIKFIKAQKNGHTLNLCFVDPDRNKSDPQKLLVSSI